MRSYVIYFMLPGRFLAAPAGYSHFHWQDYIERGSAIEHEYG